MATVPRRLHRTRRGRRRSRNQKGTKGTIEGPYYLPNQVRLPATAELPHRDGEKGTPLTLSGQVRDLGGAPLAGAEVDIWHADSDGYYSGFAPGIPDGNLRGVVVTDQDGRFAINTGVLAFSWTFPLCCFWCPIVKLALVIRWAYLAEPTLLPDVIVISLDVVEHGGPDLARVAPHVLIDQLLLDRRIKRFRRRVVVAYAGVPDRRDNTLGEKAIAVPSRGILGPAVMVHHKLAYAYSRPAGGQRIIHGLEHQARAHVVIHGPADDLIRAHVDKRREVRETRIRPDIGNIADPQLVRLRGGELAVHQVDQAADCLAVLHGRPRRRPGMHALQARGPGQAAHPPPGGDVPLLLQVPQDPLDAGPVLMPFLMQVPDPRGQLSVLLIMRRDRPLLPLVKSLPRHFQHAAHENNGKAHPGRQLPLLFRHLANEQEFHRFWLAKYALAFFRNAFSMFRRRTSASSSLIRVRSAGVSGASPTATASLSLSFLTQLARVDSFSPRFRAVSAIV